MDVGGRQSLSGIHSLYVSVGVAALFLLDSGAVLEDFRHDGGAGAHLALTVPVEDVNDIGAGHEVQEVTHGFHLLIGAGVEHDQLMSDQVAVTGSVSTGDGHSLRTGIVSSLILSSGSGSDNTGLDVPVEADLAGAEQVAQLLERVSTGGGGDLLDEQVLQIGVSSNRLIGGQHDGAVLLEFAAASPQSGEGVVAFAGLNAVGVGDRQTVDVAAQSGDLLGSRQQVVPGSDGGVINASLLAQVGIHQQRVGVGEPGQCHHGAVNGDGVDSGLGVVGEDVSGDVAVQRLHNAQSQQLGQPLSLDVGNVGAIAAGNVDQQGGEVISVGVEVLGADGGVVLVRLVVQIRHLLIDGADGIFCEHPGTPGQGHRLSSGSRRFSLFSRGRLFCSGLCLCLSGGVCLRAAGGKRQNHGQRQKHRDKLFHVSLLLSF